MPKVRWIVESVNGRIKQWKFIDKVVPNTLIPSIGDLVRIKCSICNKFCDPLAQITNHEQSTNLIQKMLNLSRNPNSLKTYLEKKNLLKKKKKKRSIYKLLNESEINDFPILTRERLQSLTIGSYQLKQASHYTKEHKDEDSTYQMFYTTDEDMLKVI
jgi:hypothetical protein